MIYSVVSKEVEGEGEGGEGRTERAGNVHYTLIAHGVCRKGEGGEGG